ncbi:hypothetical protein ABZ023_00985 [Streptomyces sp. NPDC006367]|uniref:hypothetical protein n=1 Tax=unclassified Streptomyces TaxID=2593676 RepID=UPI0033B4D8E5
MDADSSPLSTEVLLEYAGRDHDGRLSPGESKLCRPLRGGEHVTLPRLSRTGKPHT